MRLKSRDETKPKLNIKTKCEVKLDHLQCFVAQKNLIRKLWLGKTDVGSVVLKTKIVQTHLEGHREYPQQFFL